MTWKKLGLFFLLVALICTSIGIFGPMLSERLDGDYRKRIDKTGTEVRGIITLKKSHKGNSIYFKYRYKEIIYTNYEDSRFYYELVVGDSVVVEVDSIRPKNSYISRKW